MCVPTAVGETSVEPGEVVAVATPLLISTVEISLPPHVRRAEFPERTEDGETVMVQEGPPPPPPPPTVTLAVQVETWPVGLTAVPVNNVLVVIAFEFTVPDTAGVTAPIPWSIENVSAFVVVHESAEWPPELTCVGLAESVQAGAVTVVMTIFVSHVTEPPGPVAVPM